jgi:hypothetical protein
MYFTSWCNTLLSLFIVFFLLIFSANDFAAFGLKNSVQPNFQPNTLFLNKTTDVQFQQYFAKDKRENVQKVPVTTDDLDKFKKEVGLFNL